MCEPAFTSAFNLSISYIADDVCVCGNDFLLPTSHRAQFVECLFEVKSCERFDRDAFRKVKKGSFSAFNFACSEEHIDGKVLQVRDKLAFRVLI